MNLAPRLSTCSLAAGRTSVADTMAPSRRAVAIACRPATPTPMTKHLRRRTVPAAVIIIGKARPIFRGGVDHRLVAGKIGLARQHVHDCARVMRGINSIAKAVTPASAMAATAQRPAVGIHDGDDERALLDLGKLGRSQQAHLEHDIGPAGRVGGHRGGGGG